MLPLSADVITSTISSDSPNQVYFSIERPLNLRYGRDTLPLISCGLPYAQRNIFVFRAEFTCSETHDYLFLRWYMASVVFREVADRDGDEEGWTEGRIHGTLIWGVIWPGMRQLAHQWSAKSSLHFHISRDYGGLVQTEFF